MEKQEGSPMRYSNLSWELPLFRDTHGSNCLVMSPFGGGALPRCKNLTTDVTEKLHGYLELVLALPHAAGIQGVSKKSEQI